MAITNSLENLDAATNDDCREAYAQLTGTVDQLPEAWRIVRARAVEEQGWVVSLLDGGWAGFHRRAYLECIRRSLDDMEEQLWGLLYHQPDQGLAVPLTYEAMSDFMDSADALSGVLIGPNRNFCLVHSMLDWDVIAGPERVVETAVGTSLETRLNQFVRYAESDPSESVRERRKSLMRYYAPYVSGDGDSISDPDSDWSAREERVETVGGSQSEEERVDEVLDEDGFLERELVLRNEWAVAGIGGVWVHDRLSSQRDFFPNAEWLADATRALGDDAIRAMPVGVEGSPFEFRNTRDGWLAFESLLEQGTWVVYPGHSQYCVVGLPMKCVLVAGPPDFVARAVGDVSIRYANYQFYRWINQIRRREFSENVVESVRQNRDRFDQLEAWLNGIWEQIASSLWFEDPWERPDVQGFR